MWLTGGLDFGDDVRSTVTGVTGRSNLTTRTEKTTLTTATNKTKKHKDVPPPTSNPPSFRVGADGRIKFILLGMIFFLLKSSVRVAGLIYMWSVPGNFGGLLCCVCVVGDDYYRGGMVLCSVEISLFSFLFLFSMWVVSNGFA